MDLIESILKRHSVRGYTKDPVKKETLEKVIALAARAVSSQNIQPWELVVVAGETLDEIRKENIALLRSEAEEDMEDIPLPSAIYKDRAKRIGKALLTEMNITREDMAGRAWWRERGYRFFDAPAAIFLLMDKALDESQYRFDMGCLAQNICLAALAYGLGTCVEDQAVVYQAPVKRILGIPENMRFVTAISIGYEDLDFPANSVRSERKSLEESVQWYGFQ